MPIRASVCTYSPSASKYHTGTTSSILPASSSLSVGHYKRLNPSSALSSSSTSSSYRIPATGSSSKLCNLNFSSPTSYSPKSTLSSGSSTLTGNPYSSSSLVGSPVSSYASSSSSSSTSSYGHYKQLPSSTHSSFSSSRYTGGSSSSLSSSTSDYLNHLNNNLSSSSAYSTASSSSASSAYNRYSPNSARRLSYTSRSSSGSAASHLDVASKLPSGVPNGLVNLGNTCYMNAVLQAVYSIESFSNIVLRPSTSPSGDKVLTSELSDLFKSMKNSSSPVSPANFKYAFSRYQDKFSGFGQQDSQEFLRYLINGIHEEMNRVNKRPRGLGSRQMSPRAPKTSSEAWSQYRDLVDDSPLVDLLVGQLCSTITCNICDNKSYCWDPFWDLSLPLLRGKYSCKLLDIIDEFTSKETLDTDERPVCGHCKKATKSTKQISLSRLPQVLILHLKKFSNDGYKLTSPEVKIDKQLSLNHTTYTLKACISHHGHSSSSGHYTSLCEYSSKWFHFNDDRVKDVTSTFDVSKLDDAYVLIYTQAISSSKL